MSLTTILEDFDANGALYLPCVKQALLEATLTVQGISPHDVRLILQDPAILDKINNPKVSLAFVEND